MEQSEHTKESDLEELDISLSEGEVTLEEDEEQEQEQNTLRHGKKLFVSGYQQLSHFIHEASTLGVDESENECEKEATFTAGEAINHCGTGAFQLYMTVVVGSVWASEVMSVMLVSFLTPQLRKEWNLRSYEEGWIASMVFLGMLFGNLGWSLLSDRIGRRKVLTWVCLASALCSTVSAASPNLSSTLMCQFFIGVCVGGGTISSSLFAEFSPASKRGSLYMIVSVSTSIGALLSVLLAWVSLSNWNWRVYLLLNSIPQWGIWMASLTLSESPRFLSTQVRMDEAMAVLRRVALANQSSLPKGILVAESSDDDDGSSSSDTIWDALKWPIFGITLPLTFVLFNLCVCLYYGISFVSEHYFERHDGGGLGLYAQMAVVTASEFPGLLLGFLCLDTVGRKKTMVFGFTGYGLCVFLASVKEFRSFKGGSGLICLFGARLCARLVFVTVDMYNNEYYPTSVRSSVTGLIAATARVSAMIASMVVSTASIDSCLCILGALSVCSVMCAALLPFDTTGMPLSDDLDSFLMRRKQAMLADKQDSH